ncbi:sensor histidine kinase [Virgisporangium aliadipatigenens]|uniref:sensor histidine kinase n=1 Tax=Virgisporangium aliadipatigenens TaxID=741659 RepID=UPI0019454F08|nr:PAS domain-containing sensor histidine kinase [Virgisporangium aliadipatigenens]
MGELLSRAERAVGMVEVQSLVAHVRDLPGLSDLRICRGTSSAGAPEGGYVTSQPVGTPEWRLELRARCDEVATYRTLRPVLDGIADAAGRALRLPCRAVVEEITAVPPLYHVITRNARALIVVVDPLRGWTPMSEAFSSLLGYDRGTPPSGTLLDLVHPDDRAAALDSYVVACAGEHPEGCVDLRLRTASGVWRRFEFATRSFVHEPGAGVVAYFGIDVSVQRAAENAADAERGRLDGLVETLRDGILLIDDEQRITVANDALRRLLRLDEPVPLNLDRSWIRLLAQLQPGFAGGAADVARLRDIVAARHAVVGEELTLEDGRILELDFVPLEADRSGRAGGVLVHVRDVTARVLVRRGLEESNRSLAEAAALNNQFVATVAHELRGPLSSVVAFAHLLGDAGSGSLSEDQRTYLDVIDRNANRLLRLIEDLLLLSRLEARTLQLRPAPVRLPELVRSAVVDRSPAAESAGLRLVADVVEGPELTCDETRIHQVLDNLLGNALKFTPPGGEVSVRALPVDDGWQLQVNDTGMGIPAAEVARVFSAFFRGSNIAAAAGRSAPPGTGLGLVVSRAIVELHGGTIQVASTEGVGTTVTVSLPSRPVRQTEVDREPATRGRG